MIEYTIDDAIERCKDRANISALHHMMRTSQEWELTAVWLERLRDASSTIQVAELGNDDRGERREKLTKLVDLSYEYGQRHDRSAKEDLIRSILSGGYD
jgi:hypothetical protein